MSVTVPFAVPLCPDVTVIHVALDTAVHVQPAPAVTVIEAEPPDAPIVSDVRLREYVHPVGGGGEGGVGGGAAGGVTPACVMVYVWPAIVT